MVFYSLSDRVENQIKKEDESSSNLEREEYLCLVHWTKNSSGWWIIYEYHGDTNLAPELVTMIRTMASGSVAKNRNIICLVIRPASYSSSSKSEHSWRLAKLVLTWAALMTPIIVLDHTKLPTTTMRLSALGKFGQAWEFLSKNAVARYCVDCQCTTFKEEMDKKAI